MARQLPSLNALKAFEAAARHQAFSAAADELFVTHAAVSRHIRDLEDWLGTPLFERSGRGVVLTDTGKKLGSALTPCFDRIAGAVRDATVRKGVLRLKVSAEPSIASRWLVPRLGRFHASHPDIELIIEPTTKLAGFRDGDADLGLRYGPGHWDDVDAQLLSESWSFPVCAPSLMANDPIIEPKDIGRHQLLIEHCRESWLDWLTHAGVQGSESWRGTVFQAHLAIEAAEAGQGFALGDYVLVTEALVNGRLICPFDLQIKESWSYFIVRAKDMKESAHFNAFRTWLMREIAETRQTFEACRTKNHSVSTATVRNQDAA